MMIRIRAAAGRLIRDPRTKRKLAADGVLVSDTDTFWARRLRDGDVVIVPDAPAAEPDLSAPAADTAPVAQAKAPPMPSATPPVAEAKTPSTPAAAANQSPSASPVTTPSVSPVTTPSVQGAADGSPVTDPAKSTDPAKTAAKE